MSKVKALFHKILAGYHGKMLTISFMDGNTRAFALHMEHYIGHVEKYKRLTGVNLDLY